jgi:hypothetical protein
MVEIEDSMEATEYTRSFGETADGTWPEAFTR